MPAVARLSGCSLRQKLEAIEVFPLGGADRPWREVFIEHFEVDLAGLRASEPLARSPASIPQGLTKPLAISPQPSTSQPSARRSPRLTSAELGHGLVLEAIEL